ncbi:hypothetical protein FNH09_01675 [Streptomyces adustus]|uniref:CBS domain-containing protein n=1 Tax=Streptomyces adustus TaxID=1609272 RepID=A0A5N8V7R0_9ACTN|nr:hypothetical protein [Streptomyces adustus]
MNEASCRPRARDTLIARTRGQTVTARDPARPVPELTEQHTSSHSIELLRQRRTSLAVVRDATGRLIGMVSLDNLPARLPHPQTA